MFSFDVEQKKDVTSVFIGGELTIYSADTLFNQHIKTLANDVNIAVDLSGVEEIDTAGIQILLLLQRACEAQSKCFELSSMSEPVSRYLELFNLAGMLSSSTKTD